ncbi:hypothetical protein D3C72_1233830 [compost metagenome]
MNFHVVRPVHRGAPRRSADNRAGSHIPRPCSYRVALGVYENRVLVNVLQSDIELASAR